MSQNYALRIARVAIVATATTLAAVPALAQGAYPGDPGQIGNPASWRTPEFLQSWGLTSVGAEFAYARGFTGTGIGIGMVDSGFFAPHPDLTRFIGVTVDGVPGTYDQAYNDSHGTSILGLVGGARDGNVFTGNFHGVAFNATVYSGNTRKTDGVLFGLPQVTQTPAQTLDQGYVANVYRALAQVPDVRIIGSSWGSQPNSEQYQTLLATDGPGLTGRAGLLQSWEFLSRSDTWLAGTIDAWETGKAILISAGNTGYANASPRSGAAYYRPELESLWTAVTGVRQVLSIGGVAVGQTLNPDGSVNVPGAQLYNQCGLSKWSCVSAPSLGTATSRVVVTGGIPTAAWGTSGGTSAAQPHATAALAIIMERFPYLSNEQAVSVLRTTAIQNGTINDPSGAPIANPNAGQRVAVPDSRNGWGTVSLRYAMNGPGQFTGRFAVDTQGQSDTWSNDISDVAIRARQAEDVAEAQQWTARKAEKGWTGGLPAGATLEERTEFEVGTAREDARNSRVYAGSLAKSGTGTLTLTGINTYTGGTEVLGGSLIGNSATAFGSGRVSVLGGLLGGTTTILGDLLNAAGIISPGDSDTGAGVLTVLGSFAQMAAGTLDIDFIGGVFDLLAIAGPAMLGGILDVSFDDEPVDIGLYTLVSSSNYLGRFSALQVGGLSDQLVASLIYSGQGVQLSVAAIPEPQTWAMMVAGLGVVVVVAARRRRSLGGSGRTD